MPEQLSLLGFGATAAPFTPERMSDQGGKLLGHTLFLAIVPQSEDAQRVAAAAADLSTQHGLAGTQLPPRRLHITLHAIAAYRKTQTIPQLDVDAARAAAASVVCPPLPIVFDRALSFTESDAFVLRCNTSGDAAVARLRQSLTLALRRVGLRHKPSSTPHMTLLYDKHHIAERPIEPICWTASRFALILSHVGVGHHQWIDQWPLADRH